MHLILEEVDNSQKTYKVTGSVFSRLGTLRNEVSKSLAPPNIKISSELKATQKRILDLQEGKCGYCRFPQEASSWGILVLERWKRSKEDVEEYHLLFPVVYSSSNVFFCTWV